MILLWFCYGFLMVDFMFFFACPQNSYDFDMVLLWSWSASFFSYEICYGWSYLFCKKIILSFFLDISEWKNNKLFVFKKYENLNQKQNML